MGKKKILVVPSDNIGGVGFYRSTQPHIKLSDMYPDEFDVTIDLNPNYNDHASFDQYDLIHIHKVRLLIQLHHYLKMHDILLLMI